MWPESLYATRRQPSSCASIVVSDAFGPADSLRRPSPTRATACAAARGSAPRGSRSRRDPSRRNGPRSSRSPRPRARPSPGTSHRRPSRCRPRASGRGRPETAPLPRPTSTRPTSRRRPRAHPDRARSSRPQDSAITSAVRRARIRSELYSATGRSTISRRAVETACASPTAVSGRSCCPCQRRPRFHAVSP